MYRMIFESFKIRILEFLLNILFVIIVAIPFTMAWNYIAPRYLSFIPSVYQDIAYLPIVSMLLLVTYIGDIIQDLTPKIISKNS